MPVRSESVLDVPASQHDDPGYVSSSRLSGLRNLLIALGRRSLNQDRDATGESDSHIEPRFQPTAVRQPHLDTPLLVADAPAAQPEFPRPRPVVETESEKEVVRPTPPRRDNADPEEIQTLPSWRGQYRKKRYPPI